MRVLVTTPVKVDAVGVMVTVEQVVEVTLVVLVVVVKP